MKFLLFRFVLATVFLASAGHASQLKDPSQEPISQAELERLITTTPLTSPVQFKLIPRASASGLEKVAFEQYSLIAQKQPNNGNALLLQGLAAEKYWFSARPKKINEVPDGAQEAALLKSAGMYLAKAAALLPNSAVANEACGRYLWQFGNDNADGMKLLEKAVALAPKSASAHAYLADIYSNPAPKLFCPAKAEAEFREATRLDPTYAFPRFGLARLYVDQKRFREAQTELKAYAALLPAGSAQFANVHFLQQVIDDGLSKN